MKASFTYASGVPAIVLDAGGDSMDAAALEMFHAACQKGLSIFIQPTDLKPGESKASAFLLGIGSDLDKRRAARA